MPQGYTIHGPIVNELYHGAEICIIKQLMWRTLQLSIRLTHVIQSQFFLNGLASLDELTLCILYEMG